MKLISIYNAMCLCVYMSVYACECVRVGSGHHGIISGITSHLTVQKK